MVNGCEFGTDELVELDNLIDIEVPTTVPIEFINQLHYLMSLMQEGTKKIEAIKAYRTLTNYGLKESKDMVEKYWIAKHPVNDAN